MKTFKEFREDTEIQELSKKTLGNYIKKGLKDRSKNRYPGISKASDKLIDKTLKGQEVK